MVNQPSDSASSLTQVTYQTGCLPEAVSSSQQPNANVLRPTSVLQKGTADLMPTTPLTGAGSLGAGLRWLHLEPSSAQSQMRTGWVTLQASVTWLGPLCSFLLPAVALDKLQPL